MNFVKDYSFLFINVIFTSSFLIISFQYITFDRLAFKAILIVLFTLNSIILLFSNKIKPFILFILLVLTSIYFGVQTLSFRALNQYLTISDFLNGQSSINKVPENTFSFMKMSDIVYLFIPIVALYIIIKMKKKKIAMTQSFYQVLTLVMFITFAYVQYSTFHKELKASTSNPMIIHDKEVIYANVQNTNLFVEQLGLYGLLMREFDYSIEQFEIQSK